MKQDRSILAAILCGSLAHDTVWAKSDIDLLFVTADDRKLESAHVALFADGVNIHALLMSRSEFRKTVASSVHSSFFYSFLARGRVLFTHDPTVADLWASLGAIGDRDRQVQLLRAATTALPAIDKAHKWFVTRRDLNYTALWILYAATPLAQVEVIGARMLVDREVIPQAAALNPRLFGTIYADLLNEAKTAERVQSALDAIDTYVAGRAPMVFGAILDYLREAGEARSCTEIEDYFRRNLDVPGVTTACEYLADQGLIGKASTPVRLTKKSSLEVQELAFFFFGPDD